MTHLHGHFKRSNDVVFVDSHDNKRVCILVNERLSISDKSLRRVMYQGCGNILPSDCSTYSNATVMECQPVPMMMPLLVPAPMVIMDYVKPSDMAGNVQGIHQYPPLKAKSTSRVVTRVPNAPQAPRFQLFDWQKTSSTVIYLNNDQDIVDVHGWRYVDTLGEGSYGKVYFVRNDFTGEESAFKRMLLHKSGGISPAIMREIQSLNILDHDNIIRLQRVYIGDCRIYLSFPRISGGNLRHFLEKNYPYGMPPSNIKKIAKQLIHAVAHIHSKRIIHRDIKPENILVHTDSPAYEASTISFSDVTAGQTSEDSHSGHGALSQGKEHMEAERIHHVIITDFGLSRIHKSIDIPLLYSDETKMMNSPMSPEVVTLCYRPPELLLGDYHYSFAVDIWSLGCVIFEVITGKPIFEERTEFALLIAMFKRFGTPSEEDWPNVKSLPFMNSMLPNIRDTSCLTECNGKVDPECIDLLGRMLTLSPKKRISAHEALQHPWIAGG